MSHIELEWQVPAIRDWYESLSRRFQVVRFDFRSCGLSGVVQESLGIDAYVRDLEAVVRAIEVDRLAIFANAFACAVAIRFTAAHPDKVLRLALFSPWLRMPKWIRSSLVAGPLMMETGLDFWARSNANARSGQRDSEGHYARVFRNAISPELQPRLAKAYMAMDGETRTSWIRSGCSMPWSLS
jgi:pimeloyl-ACP methyl ester carboxylesterase